MVGGDLTGANRRPHRPTSVSWSNWVDFLSARKPPNPGSQSERLLSINSWLFFLTRLMKVLSKTFEAARDNRSLCKYRVVEL